MSAKMAGSRKRQTSRVTMQARIDFLERMERSVAVENVKLNGEVHKLENKTSILEDDIKMYKDFMVVRDNSIKRLQTDLEQEKSARDTERDAHYRLAEAFARGLAGNK